MKYDFDAGTDRRNTNSLKWDVAEHELPMWVADMDFTTAPSVREAIESRASHGVFGYCVIPDSWYKAYMGWWDRRHHFAMEKEWLIFCTGVVPAISSIVRKLTTPAEKVLIQSPVYNIFYNSILNNGRQVLESRLVYDGEDYSIDFEDLETKLADPQTSLMILCNPHNPVGKIWKKDILERIGELCAKHHVLVLSDEIHCDLTKPGCDYTPFAAVSEVCRDNSITCIAPTKAFNLAGLQTAAVVVPNEVLRHKVWRGLNTDEIAEPNAFAVDAAVAAFTKGEEWLDELREYIFHNIKLAAEYIDKEIPQFQVVSSQATYLMWLHYNGKVGSASEAAEFIRRETGLYLSDGVQYGGGGEEFLRMNVACPRAVLEDGLARLKEGIIAYLEADSFMN
ncbi:MAG: pyridoxal phosphate-dependent aminotransferase [Lachnospiraceae bacterium]|nr:pyridoxal phosphate-dependent aminotransferase [Lachnospiraceae bacterium]